MIKLESREYVSGKIIELLSKNDGLSKEEKCELLNLFDSYRTMSRCKFIDEYSRTKYITVDGWVCREFKTEEDKRDFDLIKNSWSQT